MTDGPGVIFINVYEWTRSLFKDYPYEARDGREDLDASGSRVVRGGSWVASHRLARCASRDRRNPVNWRSYIGFRVVVSLAIPGY